MGMSSGAECTIDIQAEGLGAALKRMRELRELSTEEVAHRLRLQSQVIELMESGAFPGNLPEIFAKGYVKSYARLLQFSESDIATMLNSLTFHPPLFNTSYYSKQDNAAAGSPRVSHLLTGLAVLIMIALLAIWLEPSLYNVLSTWLK